MSFSGFFVKHPLSGRERRVRCRHTGIDGGVQEHLGNLGTAEAVAHRGADMQL
jgi:hypothetical protein